MTITRTTDFDSPYKRFSYRIFNATEKPDTSHLLLDELSFSDIKLFTGSEIPKNYRFFPGGWQSWDAGWEIEYKEKQPVYKNFAVPQFENYIKVPDTKIIKSKDILLGQFIIYFRKGKDYIVLASTGSKKNLPPVQFEVNRKNETINIHAYSNGKIWEEDDLCGEICLFKATSYTDLREKISKLFHDDSLFYYQKTLGKMPGGYESWYNHYNKIDESIIKEDLEYLGKTENIIKREYIDKSLPVVFQIDDGWQQGLGQWEINTERFPNGLKSITETAENKGYIPGLWLAPFIIDLRTDFAKNHPDWILKGFDGKPLETGYNPAWGGKKGNCQPGKSGSYYSLDLSLPQVLNHLDNIMEKVINQWGFRYIKLDFLFAGLMWGALKNGGAPYELYEKACQILTSRKTNKDGLPVYYLGCGMSFECSWKYFPLSRIGTDTLEKWDRLDLKILDYPARPSAYVNLKDTLGRAFWNQTVFQNDPDVIFIRNENCYLTKNEKLLIAFVNYAFGSQIMYSDDPGKFSYDEIPLTDEICKMYEKYKDCQWELYEAKKDVYLAETTDLKYRVQINLRKHKLIFS